jgi:hypothetical protein
MLAVAVVAIVVAACGVFVAPSPTAGEIGDVVAGLVLRGAAITDQVSGDAGCGDPTLFGNAVRYDVRISSDQATAPVYVLRWKSQQTFDSSEDAFQGCVNAFKQVHPGQGVSVYEDSPWRVFGPNWSDNLRSAVEAAVHAAAGASAPDEPQ